jgi:hypothetical protein
MKISALLREAPGQPKLGLEKDLIQKARLKYPGYDSQQAVSLYMADRLIQQQKTDASQNNLINTQQRAIQAIGDELSDYEAQAQETDREVERLKQLSGSLTAGSADRQQKAKVSADELEKLHKELEALKSKPGMDIEKFKKLEAQIGSLANNPSADDRDIQKLQQLLGSVQQKQSIGDKQYNDLVKKLEDTNNELERKEAEFKVHGEKTRTSAEASAEQVRNSAEEMKKYAGIIDSYKKKIDDFDNLMQSEKDKIIAFRGEIQQMADELASNISFVKPALRQRAPIQNEPAQVAAAQDASAAAINKAQTSAKGATLRKPPVVDPELFSNDVNEETNMSVRPAFDYSHDPETAEWMAKYLPMMVKGFKKKYAVELSNKSPSYNDHQIAYTIEDNIEFLFSHEEQPISKGTMDNFYILVKNDLFRQPPESSTLHMKQDDLFSESLDKTYERMLDNLIGLPYLKG